MINVFLEGKLGTTVGKKWRLKARNAVEVLRALQANTGNFLGESVKKQDNYVVLVDGKPVEGHTGMYKKIQKDMHIVPLLGGGVVFVPAFVAAVQAVGAWLAMHWAAYWGFHTAVQVIIAGTIVIGGIALISYGISMLVKMFLGDSQDGLSSTTSFIFGGPQNVSGQDVPVPIAYGRLEVGSKIISSSMSSIDRTIFGTSGFSGLTKGFAPSLTPWGAVGTPSTFKAGAVKAASQAGGEMATSQIMNGGSA